MNLEMNARKSLAPMVDVRKKYPAIQAAQGKCPG
jgi:hypothetical protein